MIGFGVFAAALLFLFGLFASSKKAQASAKNLAIATELCREAMEVELSKSYGGIDTSVAPVVHNIDGTINGVQTTTNFEARIEVNELLAPPDGVRRKIVSAIVEWDGVTGRRTARLETIVVE